MELLGEHIYPRHPSPTSIQYHVFNSAVCMGTLVIRDPCNAMAAFALAQIDAAVGLFMSLINGGASTPRYRRNLHWLQTLRSRATARMQDDRRNEEPNFGFPIMPTERSEGHDDVDLLGWHTRLIQRATNGTGTVYLPRCGTTRSHAVFRLHE